MCSPTLSTPRSCPRSARASSPTPSAFRGSCPGVSLTVGGTEPRGTQPGTATWSRGCPIRQSGARRLHRRRCLTTWPCRLQRLPRITPRIPQPMQTGSALVAWMTTCGSKVCWGHVPLFPLPVFVEKCHAHVPVLVLRPGGRWASLVPSPQPLTRDPVDIFRPMYISPMLCCRGRGPGPLRPPRLLPLKAPQPGGHWQQSGGCHVHVAVWYLPRFGMRGQHPSHSAWAACCEIGRADDHPLGERWTLKVRQRWDPPPPNSMDAAYESILHSLATSQPTPAHPCPPSQRHAPD